MDGNAPLEDSDLERTVDRTPDGGLLTQRAGAIAQLRREGVYRSAGGLKIHLARAFGFCQGVERAVELALRAADEREAQSVDIQIFLTGEIIHNPSTNEKLEERGVRILPPEEGLERLRVIRPEDWVIVPAFGILQEELDLLGKIGCRIIDTSCGWVRRVWLAVERFSEKGLTLIIHGKIEHEETRATISRAKVPYVVVRNRALAELLGYAIAQEELPLSIASLHDVSTSWPGWFKQLFNGLTSPGFEPAKDLDRLGLVNQTTMLSRETEAIAQILAAAAHRRRGRPPAKDELQTLDTFCPATQERQDAVRYLLQEARPDVMLVVGGFRSSNTAHLAVLGAEVVPTYHIEDSGCLMSGGRIRHRPPGVVDPVIASGWRPALPCAIGITSGASTPDTETDRIVAKLLESYEAEEAAGGGK